MPRLLLLASAFLAFMPFCFVQAQTSPEPVPFFDLAQKPSRPAASELRAIRFLTDDDYPPFHFPGPDGQLTGFNIDLARAICQELKVACTMQARRWDTLLPSLEDNQGDAVIASLRPKEADWLRFNFSVPYYKTPARFVMRKDKSVTGLSGTTSAALAGKTIGVVTGSAHAAFLTNFYSKAAVVSRPDYNEILRLLVKGEVDIVFGDGISLAVWLNGSEGSECCQFLGKAFFEDRFFGEGAMIAFRKDSSAMRRSVDYALFRLVETGEYQQILQKYFPIRFY
jgi:polar amino acid transport system substrate-binding protein